MIIWSYHLLDVDLLNDMRNLEIVEDATVTGWFLNRDEAFFTLLSSIVEEIDTFMGDDQDLIEEYSERRAAILDPKNWKEDEDGVVYYDSDDTVYTLIKGKVYN